MLKKKNIFTLLLILLLTIVLALSCDTTEPPDDDLKPGRRDIGSQGFPYLKSIWRSSPNNVWGAGFSEDVKIVFGIMMESVGKEWQKEPP